jgi:hypothetical protein
MRRSSSIRCPSKVIGETSCTDENNKNTRNPGGPGVTRSTPLAQHEKTDPKTKTKMPLAA